MCTNGSMSSMVTPPPNARRTGKPSPSSPRGAVVIDRTGRSRTTAGSGSGIRGRARMFSTVTAGMSRLLRLGTYAAWNTGVPPLHSDGSAGSSREGHVRDVDDSLVRLIEDQPDRRHVCQVDPREQGEGEPDLVHDDVAGRDPWWIRQRRVGDAGGGHVRRPPGGV